MAAKGVTDARVASSGRVEVAEAMYTQGFKQWQIVKALVDMYGVDKGHAAADYDEGVRRCEREIVESKDQLRLQLTAFLKDMMHSPGVHSREKIKAVHEVGWLWGLDKSKPSKEHLDQIKVEVADWREDFKTKNEKGELLSTGSGGPEDES